MSDKKHFTFLIRLEERETLKRISKATERSEGATLRWLIREAATITSRNLERIIPPPNHPTSHPTNNTA